VKRVEVVYAEDYSKDFNEFGKKDSGLITKGFYQLER